MAKQCGESTRPRSAQPRAAKAHTRKSSEAVTTMTQSMLTLTPGSRHPNRLPAASNLNGKRKRDEPLNNTNSTMKKRKLSAPSSAPSQPPAKKKATKPAARPKVVLNAAPSIGLDVFVSGSGDTGGLGLGPKIIEARSPKLNGNLSGVVQIALGGLHGIALTSNNGLLTWGVNDNGALGRDTKWDGKMVDIDAKGADGEEVDVNPYESTPMPVPASMFPSGTVFTQVAAGDSSSFVLTDDGFVYGWGLFRVSAIAIQSSLLYTNIVQNSKGDFGFNVKEGNTIDQKPQLEPKLISELKNIKQLAVGGDHALALNNKGVVYAWGAGEQSQLARRLLPRHEHLALIPTPVALPRTIVSISAGANHSFAIDKTGKVYAWGLNNFGQCGIPRNAGDSEAIITKPEQLKSLAQPAAMVAGGNHHSVALTQEGDCMVWGRLDGYQTGIKMESLPLQDENQVMKSESGRPCVLLLPTRVPNVPPCGYVAAGSDHCVAVARDGGVYSWGFNVSYQCGQGLDKEENDDGSDNEEDDLDEVVEATLIGSGAIKGKKMVWAGAGGQFSAIAAKAE